MAKQVMGYDVKKTNFRNNYKEKVEYTLTGKRGTEYQLIRNTHMNGKPKKSFFVRNPKGNIVGLKGNYTIEENWLKK